MRAFLAQTPRQQRPHADLLPAGASRWPPWSTRSRSAPTSWSGVQNVHWEDKGAFTGENSGAHGARRRRPCRARRSLGAPTRLRRDGRGDREEGAPRPFDARLTPDALRRRDARRARGGRTDGGRGAAAAARAASPSSSRAEIAGDAWWPTSPSGPSARASTATPADASAIHAVMRAELRERIGGERGPAVPICYGGSGESRQRGSAAGGRGRGRAAGGWRESRRRSGGRHRGDSRAHLTSQPAPKSQRVFDAPRLSPVSASTDSASPHSRHVHVPSHPSHHRRARPRRRDPPAVRQGRRTGRQLRRRLLVVRFLHGHASGGQPPDHAAAGGAAASSSSWRSCCS